MCYPYLGCYVIFHAVVALFLKNFWAGCVLFFFLPFSRKGNLSPPPPFPRKSLIWGHDLISFCLYMFICCFTCCCYSCGCCCLCIAFVGQFPMSSCGYFSCASLLLFLLKVILILLLPTSLGFCIIVLVVLVLMFFFVQSSSCSSCSSCFPSSSYIYISCYCLSYSSSSWGVLFGFSSFLLWLLFLPDAHSFCFACCCLVWSCSCCFGVPFP